MYKLRTAIAVALAVAASSATMVAAPAQAADLPNFRVGLQFIDKGGRGGQGVEQFTGFASFGSTVSNWAGDSNNFDPDGVRINLNTAVASLLGQVDFRIGGQARDNGREVGVISYTPWASMGGGTSEQITDSNSFDPDQYRLFLETRPLPAGVQINDIRLSVLAVDAGEVDGQPAFTRWASQGGGQSPYSFDANSFDPDGIKIGLEVQ